MPSTSIDHAFTATNLTSAASDPTFAGALSFMRRRFTKSLEEVDAVVWGIPFDAATSNRPGTRFGPQAIRRASAIFDNDSQYPFNRDLFAEMSVIDYGDCLLDYGNHQETPAAIERQATAILDSGAFMLTLGGDHFITWPLLKAHAAKHGPLARVQFDAHQDTWPDDGTKLRFVLSPQTYDPQVEITDDFVRVTIRRPESGDGASDHAEKRSEKRSERSEKHSEPAEESPAPEKESSD